MKQEPKIDYTYSGQKKLDLGFGFGTAAPAAVQDSAKQLSWERMRKVGRRYEHASAFCLVPFTYASNVSPTMPCNGCF